MYSILVDVTKCTGCEKCVVACTAANNLNPEKSDYDRVAAKDGLSANRLLSLIEVENDKFARKSCMHCVEPSCVSACLVGGITKSADGPVIYDPDKCIGCRYCMLSCPFHIPRYEWDKQAPYIKKCNMCFEKLEAGGHPACVGACPNGALEFGERSELLSKAKSLIAADRSKYFNHVWGEKEFGGTSVLYVSDVGLDKLGWPEYDAKSIPEVTDPLIEKTPVIGLSVASSLMGISWIINRRQKIAKENKKSDKNTRPESEEE